MLKIFIWGTGEIARKLTQNCMTLDMYDILGYIDNRIEKQGKIFEGNKIYNPEILNEIVPDKIVVMTNAYEEIYNQICKYFHIAKISLKIKIFSTSKVLLQDTRSQQIQKYVKYLIT